MKIIMKQSLNLNTYEKEIYDAIENCDLVPEEIPAFELKQLRQAANYTIAQNKKKTKNINFRISPHDAESLKQKAAEHAIPYQALLSMLIHQYVTGRIKLNI